LSCTNVLTFSLYADRQLRLEFRIGLVVLKRHSKGIYHKLRTKITYEPHKVLHP